MLTQQLDAAQYAEGIDGFLPDEIALRQHRLQGEIGTLAALGRMRKNIVDGKQTAGHHMARPSEAIQQRLLMAVAAIDEHQTQGRSPFSGDGLRLRHQGHYCVLQLEKIQGFTQSGKGIHAPAMRIEQIWIVVFLTYLMLLRSAVMIRQLAILPTSTF